MSPNSSFSWAGLWTLAQRWKYLLGAALLLAAVVSAGVALWLPNIYASTAVFLPTSPQSSDPDRLVEGGSNKLELAPRAEDLDRVITIGQSLPVAELMIKRFGLYRHYNAGQPGDDQADNYVLYEFSSNLSIVHNERDAIELTFLDRDKHLAANVANAMVAAIDSVNQQLTLENRRNVLGLYRQRYADLSRTFEQSRQQLLAARRHYGIYGLEMQGRYLAKTLIETEKELRVAEGGGPGNAAALRRALRGLTRRDGGNAVNLESWTAGADSVNMAAARLADIQSRLVGTRAAYEQAETALRSRLSSIYQVQKAYPATRKSKPFRAVIVLVSVLATLALSLLVIFLLEVFRRK